MTDVGAASGQSEKKLSRTHTIAAFAATTILSGGVSILSIPLIVSFTSAATWGSIALGQAVGSSVSVLAMFGWGITGPALIAMSPARTHAIAYWNSVVARGLLFLPAVIVTIVVTWLIVPSEPVASTVFGVAMAFGGLSGSWYAVGRKRPDKLFILDTVPRIGGTLAGVVALWLGGSLLAFGFLQLAGSFLAFLLMTYWATSGFTRPDGVARSLREIVKVISDQRHGVAMAVAIASYYPVVLAIVAGFAPRYLPLYALNEKVLRFAVMAMQPIFQYFQATVPGHQGAALRRAILRSLGIICALGAICWVGYSTLLPVASSLLTHGQVGIPLLVGINLGAYMGTTVLVTYLSTVALIAVGRVSVIGRGALLSSAIGLITVLVFVVLGGGQWISWGFIMTNLFILLYEFVILLRSLPHRLLERQSPIDPGAVRR